MRTRDLTGFPLNKLTKYWGHLKFMTKIIGKRSLINIKTIVECFIRQILESKTARAIVRQYKRGL